MSQDISQALQHQIGQYQQLQQQAGAAKDLTDAKIDEPSLATELLGI